MAIKFVVSHEGQELGPFSEEEIRAMLLANKLYPVDYIFDEPTQDWVLINERFSLNQPATNPPPKSAPPEIAAAAAAKADGPPPPDMVVRRNVHSTPLASHANHAQTPVQKTPTTAATPAAAKNTQGTPAASQSKNRVQFSGGVGTVSLTQLKAGKVSLRLKDFSTHGLAGTADIDLVIVAGPINQFLINAPAACTAGEEFIVEIKSFDAFENFVADFAGELIVELAGAQSESKPATFHKGIARVHFKPTKAENVQIKVKDPRASTLKMPAHFTVAVHPGRPTKLLVDAPTEAQAGQAVDLKVRAVDAFGNLVTDFKGDIDLAVETQPLGKVS